MEKSSAEISCEIALKEQELANLIDNTLPIDQEILLIQRSIIELQHKKKDLEIENLKGKHLIKKQNIELRLLKNKFWAVKNSGL